MPEYVTTRWKNLQGRAEFLKRVTERQNCGDIEGEVLTEAERFAYAICQELDDIVRMIKAIRKKRK